MITVIPSQSHPRIAPGPGRSGALTSAYYRGINDAFWGDVYPALRGYVRGRDRDGHIQCKGFPILTELRTADCDFKRAGEDSPDSLLMSRGVSSPSLRKGGADVQGGGGGKLPSATILTDWTHRLSQRLQ